MLAAILPALLARCPTFREGRRVCRVYRLTCRELRRAGREPERVCRKRWRVVLTFPFSTLAIYDACL